MRNALLSRLTELDAAPRTELSAADLDRRERLLRTVLSDTARPGRSAVVPFRRPLVRSIALTVAGTLAAGAALLAVLSDRPGPGGSGPLSAAQVATWTATATPTAGDVTDAGSAKSSPLIRCLKETKEASGEGGPGELSNTDMRGTIASMIITRHGHAAYCLAGSDGSGVAVAIGPAVGVPADGVTLDAQGAQGGGSARFHYAVGSMGSDVKEITVRDHRRTVHATVRQIRTLPYGRWTAWWPESDSHDQLTGTTITVTLNDGTTRTVNGNSLMK
ncbi:hypothetical protein [Streptomyces sp. NPDC048665]|uniref:hypothetical protein n=1 Tax=Streptomyces sp. NPDC048665 TaxID=3155490 RepID=UPI003439E5A9